MSEVAAENSSGVCLELRDFQPAFVNVYVLFKETISWKLEEFDNGFLEPSNLVIGKGQSCGLERLQYDAAVVFLPNAIMRMVDLAAKDLHSDRVGGGRRGWLREGREP